MFCFFFFSSRRRHTRFDCDWSSDVCSSDLFRFELAFDLNPCQRITHDKVVKDEQEVHHKLPGCFWIAKSRMSEQRLEGIKNIIDIDYRFVRAPKVRDRKSVV